MSITKPIGRISPIKEFVERKPFFRHVLVLVTGTTLAQLIAVVASPILTRLYSPKEFGLLTVYMAILFIFALLGSLQYENALPLPEEDEPAACLLVLSFLILTAMCLLSGLLLWVFRKMLINNLHVSDLAGFLWLIPFSLLGVGTYNILSSWSVRRKTFRRIAHTKVTQSLGMVGTMLTGGFLGLGLIGLLLGDVMGRMGGSGRLAFLFVKEERSLMKKVTPRGIIEAAVRYKKFPQLSVGSSLMRELCEQTPALFLSMAYGPWVVGLFMLVQRVLGMPLSLIGYSVGSVFTAEAMEHIQKNNNAQVMVLYWQTVKHLFLIALPVLALLAVCAGVLVPFVFGPQWREAGFYLRILCPMYLFQFIAIPVSSTLYVLERQDLQFIREAVRSALLVSVMIVVMAADLSSSFAFILLSGAGSVSFLLYGLASWLAIKQNRKPEAAGM